MGLDIQLKNGMVLAFPTPIARVKLVEADQMNGPLKKTILERAEKEDGVRRHNVGGWRSKEDLFGWPGGEIEAVKKGVNRAVAQLTQLTLGLTGKVVRGEVNAIAWANVCRKGDYIKQHIHPLSTWAGVYFVSGEREVEGKPESGVLEFVDPRGAVDVLSAPGKPFGGTFRVKPEPGLLVVHPGWLAHFMNPYWGDEERISIAFNAFVKEVTVSDAEAKGEKDDG
jgi:uncharacterized protein (TIGR02466 family)